MLSWKKSLITGFLSLLLAGLSSEGSKAIAAETLELHLGLGQASLKVDDLENWLETGEMSQNLHRYRWVLTSQVRNTLKQKFYVDPVVASSFLEQLWQSEEGDQLLEQLNTIFPNSDRETLKKAIAVNWQQTENLSVLSLIHAYPKLRLSVDLGAVIRIALQWQSRSLQKQLLRPQLQQLVKKTQTQPIPSQLDPTKKGSEVVYLDALAFRDQKRHRNILVDVYYAKNTSGSLVVMSHGFAADRQFGAYLARHLASYGFTVVSIEHPGSNIQALVDSAYGMNLENILPKSEFIDRPKDVSFILDQLTKLSETSFYFKDKFNTNQVAIIGHSFGGYTALALAGATLDLKGLRQFCQQIPPLGRSPADWLQCAAAKLPYRQQQFKDSRIKQVIALNPIIGQLFNNLSSVNVPTLILSSSEDGITPIVTHQLQPFQALGGQKYLLLAVGGTHMSVTDTIYLNSTVAQSTLVREVMGKEAEGVRNGIQATTLAFLKQLSSESSQYQSFLTTHSLQSFSDSSVQMYVMDQLPLAVRLWSNTVDLGTRQLTATYSPKKPNLPDQWWYSLGKARYILTRPYSCTRQVDEMLTVLLNNDS